MLLMNHFHAKSPSAVTEPSATSPTTSHDTIQMTYAPSLLSVRLARQCGILRLPLVEHGSARVGLDLNASVVP